jgi:Fic family protein
MPSSESQDNDVAPSLIDPRRADPLYRPFPSFTQWAGGSLDVSRWDRYVSDLREQRQKSPELLSRALEIARRAAAFDTGALEGLYETDLGFTLSVAMQSALWEAALDQKGPNVKALFQSQLNAYDYILDFATRAVPIAEAWIRELQAQICEAEKTYQVWTEIGWQKQPLPKGEYKHLPNHVLLAGGSFHSYAPVDMTPTEMFRFCQELRTQRFLEAHPILQASYAHYGLVVIHPFADGNGRVARALGSVFTFRAESVPLLILVDVRKDYLESLRAADAGDYQSFIDFTMERALDAIQMASESIKAASVPSPEDKAADIRSLYKTKGGYTHAQVDAAGFKYIDLLKEEFKVQLEKIRKESGVVHPIIQYDYSGNERRLYKPKYKVAKPTSRHPSPSGQRLTITLSTPAPSSAWVERSFGVEVPMDCGLEDDLVLQDLKSKELFETRVTALIPEPNTAVRMRLSIWVEKILGEMVALLHRRASRSGTKKVD